MRGSGHSQCRALAGVGASGPEVSRDHCPHPPPPPPTRRDSSQEGSGGGSWRWGHPQPCRPGSQAHSRPPPLSPVVIEVCLANGSRPPSDSQDREHAPHPPQTPSQADTQREAADGAGPRTPCVWDPQGSSLCRWVLPFIPGGSPCLEGPRSVDPLTACSLGHFPCGVMMRKASTDTRLQVSG